MSCLPVWLLVATLGQAPGADGLLEAVPAEADVVIRVRGVESAREDVLAMLKALSPALGQQAEPVLEQGVAQLHGLAGDEAVRQPFLAMMRVAKLDNPASPPIAFVVGASQYSEILKSLAGGRVVVPKREEGGYDSFDGPGGQTWFAAKGTKTFAFGPDKALVAAFAKPGAKGLGKTLAPGLRKRLFDGDLGLYVNVAGLASRFGDEIAQAKQAMTAGFDQAGQQQPVTAAAMEMTKAMYVGLFDAIKEADALALSLNFAADGLAADGALTVKADSKAARAIAGARPGDTSSLAKLPADASFFSYLNLDAKTFESFQKLTVGMMSGGGKPSPEFLAALAKQPRGRVESTSAMTMGRGMRMFNLYTLDDPRALLASSMAMMAAIKGSDSPMKLYKDVTVTRDAEAYGGFTFSRIEMTIDPDKLAKLTQGNPAQAAQMQAIIGGNTITNWYGVNDKQLLQITAKSWDQAKAQIDAYKKGEGSLGASAGFRAARAKLPKDVNVLFLLSAQGIVRQVAAQLGGPPTDDLPREPVLIGASMTTVPGTGFEFRLVVPSAVGPIVEKRMGGAAVAPPAVAPPAVAPPAARPARPADMTTVPGTGFEFRLVVPSAVGPIVEKRMGGAAVTTRNP